MKTVLLNYADAAFAGYQRLNSLTGRRYGFGQCLSYGPHDIDADFSRRHAATLNADRGAGYWLWKPYFVAKTLAELADGDLLFYADAATHFVNPIAPMIELMDRHGLDLFVLGEGFSEAQYTKRDALVLMGADTDEIVRGPQRFASAFMLRAGAWSRRFAGRFLSYAEDDRILTDKPNQCGLPDYSGFVAHRHDQSIFSLLSKLQDVEHVPSDFIALGHPERGRQILNHTRSRLTPGAILTRLLSQGVLSTTDLGDLKTSRKLD